MSEGEKNQLLISIIVPVYNVAAYIERCVDSIVAQTYENIEIILVDDGSTDGSGEICDAYARRDDRVQVIHKVNGGLSDARNVGLEHMTGEYVSFIDSDDCVSPDYVEVLHHTLLVTQAELSICSFLEFYTDMPPIWNQTKRKNQTFVWERQEALSNLLYQKHFTPAACGRLYRADLWDHVRFPVGKLYEDVAVMHLIFAQCCRISYVDASLYYYYQRSGSIMRTFNRSHGLDRLNHGWDIVKYVDENVPELKKAARSRLLSLAVLTLDTVPVTKENNQIILELKRAIRYSRKTVIFDRQARMSNRIAAMVSYIGIPGLKMIERIYHGVVHGKIKK